MPAQNGNAETAVFSFDSVRFQQVYGAEAFPSLAPVGGGWLTGIGFELVSGSYQAGFNYINAQISFSTTTRPVDGLSTTFAENVGRDEQVVIGPADISFEYSPGAPAGKRIRIDFTTPFFYDPNQGNLLMDLRMFRGVAGIFETPLWDASNLSTDRSSRLYALDRDDLVGVADTSAVITGFRFTALPEPSFTALAVAALAALSLFRLRRKSSTRKE